MTNQPESGVRLKRLFLIALLASMIGCSRKPDIPGFHWGTDWVGDTLYTSDGREAASVIGGQACLFNPSGVAIPFCTNWETHQEAIDYVERTLKQGAKP
jgi:hypothetical protein